MSKKKLKEIVPVTTCSLCSYAFETGEFQQKCECGNEVCPRCWDEDLQVCETCEVEERKFNDRVEKYIKNNLRIEVSAQSEYGASGVVVTTKLLLNGIKISYDSHSITHEAHGSRY